MSPSPFDRNNFYQACKFAVMIYFFCIDIKMLQYAHFTRLYDYTPICFTVKVVFTPLPSVMPTASNAEIAISITSPAVRAIIKLPLYSEPTPTDSTLEIVACGIAVPFLRTDIVTVVPRAAETFV